MMGDDPLATLLDQGRPTTWSAVVLAAGLSTRMQGRQKLLLPMGGKTVIRHTVENLLAAGPQELVVVTGHRGSEVIAALAGLPLRFEANLRCEEGQMTSVAAGVAALAMPGDAVMVALGDMVLLRAQDYRELMTAFSVASPRSILVPFFRGQRGNPIVFSVRHVPQVVAGTRNMGCRKLATDYPDEVYRFEADHDRYTSDVDTPDDYLRICARLGLNAQVEAWAS